MHAINNAPLGFKNLLGTRVHLFTHQVDTVVRALSDNPCRLMLADEVGLGKTIEALAIIKGLLDKKPKLRSLIVVPDTLIYQWQTEISFKFWQNAPIWGIDEIDDPQILLVSTKALHNDYDKISKLHKWDMCVVDETHKLLNNQIQYDIVLNMCKSTDNVLLLSATPILHREQEYYKLLTLLNPARFEHIAPELFNNLLFKQKGIQDIVFNLMRDLPDYIKYNLHDEFVDNLNQINEEINDDKINELISGIKYESDDFGLSQVKLILSYIAEFYQIERGIIRHRRAEIESSDIKRKLLKIPYSMAGSDVGFYEQNTYDSVLELASDLCLDKSNIAIAKDLLSAVTSSPFAVNEVLNKYKQFLKDKEISSLISNNKNWLYAYENEINRILEVSDDIDNFYSKFAKIVDYIDQEDIECNKKFLIFTGFISTAVKLEECFKRFFGEDSTCSFHSGKTPEEMQDAATQFQNDQNYRFMICDESGGEGRNFQLADYIIHCDLPWSPATLEQRIGRLDRIGRKNGKDVLSLVVFSEQSIENDLFNIYDKGLNVFNKSLCGMEIAFEQIHNTIEDSLIRDINFGLSSCLSEIMSFAEQINEEIEKERYYDIARQLDIDLQEKLKNIISHFTDNNGEELMNTMMAWPHMAGFKGITVSDVFKDGSKVVSINTSDLSLASMENTLYFPPRMDEIIRRSKYKNDIRGTFSREDAVKHENLTFFAPFNPFFDSITTNAEECYKGRSVAFKYSNCEFEWMGLILTWNIKFNPQELFSKKLSPDLITLINRFLPSEQLVFSQGFNQEHNEINVQNIIDEIDKFKYKKPIHLGKRQGGYINQFKKVFPQEIWRDYVKNTYKLSKKFVSEQANIMIEADNARNELERILTANHAREVFYGYTDENLLLKGLDEIDALMYGLENPILDLDSIAFVILDKNEI